MPLLLPPYLFDYVVRYGKLLTLVAWKAYRPLGSHFLAWPSLLPVFVGLLARDPAMTLHCSCYIVTSILILCYPWAFGLMLLPVPFSTSLPLLSFIGQHSCCASPFPMFLPLLGFIGQHSYCVNPFYYLGFLGSFASSLPLLLPLAFAKSFGLPQPNYYMFTSHYFLGLLAFKPTC